MNKVNGAVAFLLVTSLGLGCNDGALPVQRPAKGGQIGDASGGALGSGGAISSQVESGTGGARGGAGGLPATGGNATGAAVGTGGGPGAGGRSGTGGTNSGGTRGTSCPLIACSSCPYGSRPNPDPCGCPICAAPDAGSGKDAAPDAECIALPCAPIICLPGTRLAAPPCGCPTCEPVDAGQPDLAGCPPVACPTIGCTGGTVPNPDPCGCPICAPGDAAAETTKLACADLDECACRNANGCAPIVQLCYCPFPQCGNGACICGGGKFIGCAPVSLGTCATARSRVAALCPELAGTGFDNLCASSSDGGCITKCLNQVSSCGDILCSFGLTCDRVADPYTMCMSACKSALTARPDAGRAEVIP
jgi:hypothetical protein